MVADRTDAAQALHHHRRFPIRTTLDEFLEAAEFHDVQTYLMHAIVLVKQQRHLTVTFHARYRVDSDSAQILRMFGSL